MKMTYHPETASLLLFMVLKLPTTLLTMLTPQNTILVSFGSGMVDINQKTSYGSLRIDKDYKPIKVLPHPENTILIISER